MPSFTEIAESILADAKRLDAHISSKGLPPSSFERDTLDDLPGDLQKCRDALVDSTQTLKQLALGPTGVVLEVLFSFTDLMSLRFIHRYGIPQYVPTDGEISFEEIARAGNLDESLVRRFLRHAMMNRIFQKPRLGYVEHTAASRMLRVNPEAMDTVGFMVEDVHPASTKTFEALEKYPGSGEPNETGYNIETNTSDSFYIELAKDPERARRFGGGMRFLTRGSIYDINHLIRGWEWSELDRAGCTVVDVGGGHGAVSRALAGATSKLKFIVQDLPDTAKEGARLVPEELRGRISFMAHDIFTTQPVKGADLYFFRFVFHNWSDKYSLSILRNLLPAMKYGSRVLIYEFLPADVAETSWTKRMPR
ncbi:hypothetical protein MMC07_009423 [Pseudocyphellaria aurata]|nr:hypothetical protein [Pseudocyphellaria aurata]